MSAGKLRADVMHVVVHPAQDHIGNCLRGVPAGRFVAVQFLDPLEIDDRSNTDQQIDVLGDIDLIGHDRAVQPFVKQQVGVGR